MSFGIKTNFNNVEEQEFEKVEVPVQQKVEDKRTDTKADDIDITKLKPEPQQNLKDVFEPLDGKSLKKKNDQPKSKESLNTISELTDATVLDYFNKKNETEFKSLDEFKNSFVKEVEKPVEKIVNPYEDVLDEEDKAYLNYKKETGRSRKEFDFLAQDFKSKSALDLAIDKIKSETGLKISDSEAKSFLQKKLDIDFDEELTSSDHIELNSYVKSYRDTLIAEQDKYRKPLEEALQKKVNEKPGTPLYRTPDGRALTEDEYKQEIKNVQDAYIENIKKGVSSATPSEFNIEIGDNGEKRKVIFKYEYSDKDRQSMVSDASNIDAMIQNRYNTKNGFDHSQLAKGLWWGDEKNQQKVIAAAMQQARAEAIAEIAARDNNENFSRKPLETIAKKEDGYGSLEQGIAGTTTGFGVKFSI